MTYTTQAIMCSDAPDVTANDTMENVFKIIISTSQNLSHMCMSRYCFSLGLCDDAQNVLVSDASQWPATTFACSFWPERAVERYTGPFNKTLANNILVIGNTVSRNRWPYYPPQVTNDLLSVRSGDAIPWCEGSCRRFRGPGSSRPTGRLRGESLLMTQTPSIY